MTEPPLWTGALLISAAIFGPAAGWYARTRERQPLVWAALGALVGPFALILLRMAPPGRCPACESSTRGWPDACDTCGWPLVVRLDDPTGASAGAARGRAVAVPILPDATPVPIAPAGGPRTVSGEAGIRRWATSGSSWSTTPQRPPAPERPPAREGEILATAVYFGGTAGLVVGSRYALVRRADRLRLMGPIDWDPTATALDLQLDSLTVTSLDDRLIIRSDGWRGVALAFGSLAGSSGADLELALDMPAAIASGMRPA